MGRGARLFDLFHWDPIGVCVGTELGGLGGVFKTDEGVCLSV
jgi:hypothetical protein